MEYLYDRADHELLRVIRVRLGGAVGGCAVYRLCNNACYVKMASIETAVWRNEGKIKIPNVSK